MQALVLKFGGLGMFVVTFFDSSILAFPFFPDAVVMELCASNPARMPYYVFHGGYGIARGMHPALLAREKRRRSVFTGTQKGKRRKFAGEGG